MDSIDNRLHWVLGLHNSIISNSEIFLDLVFGNISFVDYISFLVLELIGKTVGGAAFIALLKVRALKCDIKKFKDTINKNNSARKNVLLASSEPIWFAMRVPNQ